ncbi:uncharacterized protein LOC133033402 [Cannabis sativa]|uniref:uncharacterized protein LOC133033402 n=1 Tax=Cannabis sativa TaxID=3483 RepID=UPI0029CA23DA|nr:uncharacterized protein LOC133033402 [Cannabis sativa]
MSDFLDRADHFIKLEEAIERAEVELKSGHLKAPSVISSVQETRSHEKDVSKRDMTKFCRFHGDYGHDTNKCNNLKQEIEFLIRKNNAHVQKYVKTNQNQRVAQTDNNQDLLPPPVDGHVQVRSCPGDSGKARERYARTLQHEQEEDVLVIEERKHKIPQEWEPPIMFNDEDAVKINFPYNDLFQIANKMVARTMIDNGAYANILF